MDTLFKVPLKVMALFVEPLVASKVVAAPKVTLLPKVCTPDVVIVAPLIAVVPAAPF